jgi:hypothetical protein
MILSNWAGQMAKKQNNIGNIPWRENATYMMTLYSILTAMVGIFLVVIIPDKDLSQKWCWPVSLLSFSLVAFVWGTEKFSDALEDNDVEKYLAWFLAYNLGVIVLFLGIACYICLHYHIGASITIYSLAIIATSKWIYDILFLLFINDNDYQDYRKELLGERIPKKQKDFLIRIHLFIRKILFGEKSQQLLKLPHLGVYTKLKRSGIHGIGVFAIIDIAKGTNIFGDDGSEMIWVDKDSLGNLEPEIQRLYEDFCVLNNNKYGCPKNFNSLTVGWYLNDSKENPNVKCDENYDFIALREIKKGEELLVDYLTYSDSENV